MMCIRKESDEFVCDCDECGQPYYGGAIDDFNAFIKELKRDHWSIVKDDEGWRHTCPDCTNSR